MGDNPHAFGVILAYAVAAAPLIFMAVVTIHAKLRRRRRQRGDKR